MSWITLGCICFGAALIVLIVCMAVALHRDAKRLDAEEARELQCGEGDE
jgi:hypothetical protein